ncbi:hypothetical protein GCM10009790_22180 [Georgenia ruanii]
MVGRDQHGAHPAGAEILGDQAEGLPAGGDERGAVGHEQIRGARGLRAHPERRGLELVADHALSVYPRPAAAGGLPADQGRCAVVRRYAYGFP